MPSDTRSWKARRTVCQAHPVPCRELHLGWQPTADGVTARQDLLPHVPGQGRVDALPAPGASRHHQTSSATNRESSTSAAGVSGRFASASGSRSPNYRLVGRGQSFRSALGLERPRTAVQVQILEVGPSIGVSPGSQDACGVRSHSASPRRNDRPSCRPLPYDVTVIHVDMRRSEGSIWPYKIRSDDQMAVTAQAPPAAGTPSGGPAGGRSGDVRRGAPGGHDAGAARRRRHQDRSAGRRGRLHPVAAGRLGDEPVLDGPQQGQALPVRRLPLRRGQGTRHQADRRVGSGGRHRADQRRPPVAEL